MPIRTVPPRARRPGITQPETACHVPQALEPPPRAPWGRALAVLAVIGAAHLGLFLLLTASARKEVFVRGLTASALRSALAGL